MDLYSILKFFHVAAAMVWVGGGFVLMLLGVFAQRARNAEDLLAVVRQVAVVGPRVFLPASVLALGSGLGTVWAGGWAWEAWVILGLGGMLFTALFGQFALKPRADLIVAWRDDPRRRRDTVRAATELLALARIDVAVLLTVVALMVLKPGWADLPVFATIGLVLAAAAIVGQFGRIRAAV